MSSGRVESQYLVGSASPSGHSRSSHSSVLGFREVVVAVGGADPDPGVARYEPVGRALAPGHGFPGLRRKADGQGLGPDRLVFGIAPLPPGRAAAPGPRLGRQRPGPGRPPLVCGWIPAT